ncbi:MAG: hypothetical protein ACYC6M_06250 [Terriglobales bacterium]
MALIALASYNDLELLPAQLTGGLRAAGSASESVAAHRVTSVFGYGGSYLSRATFVATIPFTTEVLRLENAMHFPVERLQGRHEAPGHAWLVLRAGPGRQRLRRALGLAIQRRRRGLSRCKE